MTLRENTLQKRENDEVLKEKQKTVELIYRSTPRDSNKMNFKQLEEPIHLSTTSILNPYRVP